MRQATYAPARQQHRTSDPSSSQAATRLTFTLRTYSHNGTCLSDIRTRYGARRWFEIHPF